MLKLNLKEAKIDEKEIMKYKSQVERITNQLQ